MKHVAFDLEIVKELPYDQDWEPYRPFGISIISTCTNDWQFRTWPWVPDDNYRYPIELPAEQAVLAVAYLMHMVDKGYKIVTLNGLGFDFRVLAEHLPDDPGIQTQIAQLACSEHHIDIGFAMLCELGWMCGLQAACDGFGLPGKSEGITGKLIPQLWRGTLEQQEQCLEYCRNDVAMTSLVWQSMLQHGLLRYKTKTGNLNTWAPSNFDTLNVAASLQKPESNRVRSHWSRYRFAGWLEYYNANTTQS